ncbi:MAG: AAA family ATPase [Coriobacteriia bacterium]|nr:AAA family ATPase [Coriobacteriia bacterium]
MKLERIEALRYGALENACIEGLGQGLTVVLGPNESGKSTFTALTRHVLYGYPDARTREVGYTSATGPRAARLVFADPDGEWAVDRLDGPKRGPVTVRTLRGAERPGLLGELVGGVSEQSYKVVFGFGIDELAEIESAAGNDIVGRLYAAGAGLGVNPMDVRARLEQLAGERFMARASKPAVNANVAQMRELRDRIRVLEDEAARYAGEQERLRRLDEEVVPLKARRAELEAQAIGLERDAQRGEDALEQLAEIESRLAATNSEITELERSVDLIAVDERILANAPALSTVLEGAPVFAQRLERIAALEASVDETRRRIRQMSELPEAATDSVENRTMVDSYRDRLAALRAESEAAARNAEFAETRAAGNDAVMAEPAGKAAKRRSQGLLVVSAAAAVVGVAIAGAGLLSGQVAAAVLGGAVTLIGLIALIALLVRRPAPVEQSLAAEAARLKADAKAQRDYSIRAAQKLSDLEAEWLSWLADHHLEKFGSESAAVRQLLEQLRERCQLEVDAERLAAEAQRERSAAEDWVVRLVDVHSFDETAGQLPPLSVAAELAARAKAALQRTIQDDAERSDLMRRLDASKTESHKLAKMATVVRSVLQELSVRHDVDSMDPVPRLRAFSIAAREELERLRTHVDEVSSEASMLRGKLNEDGRGNEMARLRQQMEGLRASATDAADAYVVQKLAVGLLDRARERFERERQPEVVRTAARVFSAMTQGRYTDLRVSLDSGEVVVLAADGTQRISSQLSRGTAEQLYLALRVGLIGSLGELGRSLPVLMDDVVVNFDPERRAGAVAAVSELAAMRQVVFFTCHPETADVLVGSVPGALLVTLERCAL